MFQHSTTFATFLSTLVLWIRIYTGAGARTCMHVDETFYFLRAQHKPRLTKQTPRYKLLTVKLKDTRCFPHYLLENCLVQFHIPEALQREKSRLVWRSDWIKKTKNDFFEYDRWGVYRITAVISFELTETDWLTCKMSWTCWGGRGMVRRI